MQNSSTILPNEVQTMSAGTGVFHSEFNNSATQEVHLLQIWIMPRVQRIAPNYGQKSFAAAFAKSDFVLVVSGLGRDGSIAINQDAEIFVAKFLAGREMVFAVKQGRKIWIQIVAGEILINGQKLTNGDAAALSDEEFVKINAQKNSEFLLFDLRG